MESWWLSLRDRNLGSLTCAALEEYIQQAVLEAVPAGRSVNELYFIDLRDNSLTPDHAPAIATLHVHYPSLRTLLLSGNMLSDEGVLTYLHAIRQQGAAKPYPMEKLDLEYNGLTFACVPTLSDLLIRQASTLAPNLATLVLAFNDLGDDSCPVMARAFVDAYRRAHAPGRSSKEAVLTTLDITGCGVSMPGLSALATAVQAALRSGHSLTIINSDDDAGAQGAASGEQGAEGEGNDAGSLARPSLPPIAEYDSYLASESDADLGVRRTATMLSTGDGYAVGASLETVDETAAMNAASPLAPRVYHILSGSGPEQPRSGSTNSERSSSRLRTRRSASDLLAERRATAQSMSPLVEPGQEPPALPPASEQPAVQPVAMMPAHERDAGTQPSCAQPVAETPVRVPPMAVRTAVGAPAVSSPLAARAPHTPTAGPFSVATTAAVPLPTAVTVATALPSRLVADTGSVTSPMGNSTPSSSNDPDVVSRFQQYVASQVESAVAERTAALENIVRAMAEELAALRVAASANAAVAAAQHALPSPGTSSVHTLHTHSRGSSMGAFDVTTMSHPPAHPPMGMASPPHGATPLQLQVPLTTGGSSFMEGTPTSHGGMGRSAATTRVRLSSFTRPKNAPPLVEDVTSARAASPRFRHASVHGMSVSHVTSVAARSATVAPSRPSPARPATAAAPAARSASPRAAPGHVMSVSQATRDTSVLWAGSRTGMRTADTEELLALRSVSPRGRAALALASGAVQRRAESPSSHSAESSALNTPTVQIVGRDAPSRAASSAMFLPIPAAAYDMASVTQGSVRAHSPSRLSLAPEELRSAMSMRSMSPRSVRSLSPRNSFAHHAFTNGLADGVLQPTLAPRVGDEAATLARTTHTIRSGVGANTVASWTASLRSSSPSLTPSASFVIPDTLSVNSTLYGRSESFHYASSARAASPRSSLTRAFSGVGLRAVSPRRPQALRATRDVQFVSSAQHVLDQARAANVPDGGFEPVLLATPSELALVEQANLRAAASAAAVRDHRASVARVQAAPLDASASERLRALAVATVANTPMQAAHSGAPPAAPPAGRASGTRIVI